MDPDRPVARLRHRRRRGCRSRPTGPSCRSEAQDGVEGSTLELYRQALRLRRELLRGEDLEWVDSAPADAAVPPQGRPTARCVGCVVNLGSEPVPLPAYDEVLLASGPLDDGALPADTAVWLRLS